MVRALLYTTINMLFMPDALQMVTISFMVALELRAVLAVVVTHTPLRALGSHAGGGGSSGGGAVQLTSVRFLQEDINNPIKIRQINPSFIQPDVNLSNSICNLFNYFTNLIIKIIKLKSYFIFLCI
jgi:hypothetical protein